LEDSHRLLTIEYFSALAESLCRYTQFLVGAKERESMGRDQGFLLHGMELKAAVHWSEQASNTTKSRNPTESQEQYIRSSEEWEAGNI
jgi:hypothetical protein